MSPWDMLRRQCPRLYRNGIAFECGHGWYNLLHDLSLKIEEVLDDMASCRLPPEGENDDIEMFAVQVKEKYGTLRFYMSTTTEEIEDLIGDAEALSSQTCDTCGAPAKMRGTTWLEVKCDKCYRGKS